jgi:hypothetical protein
MFEAYRTGQEGDCDPRDFVTFTKFGHCPFSNFLMDPRTGDPLEWDIFSRLDKTYPNGWAPAVPSEIRWWTKKLGIFDDAGVNKLRPLIAQYWC